MTADPSPPPPDRLAEIRQQLPHAQPPLLTHWVRELVDEVERLRKIQPGLVAVTVGEDIFTADELAREVERLRGLLARLEQEWSGNLSSCPVCAHDGTGHSADCWLAAELHPEREATPGP